MPSTITGPIRVLPGSESGHPPNTSIRTEHTVGIKRPFKVTMKYAANETRKEINATDSFSLVIQARLLAQTVSQAGGSARVWVRDPDSKDIYTLRSYTPYEIGTVDSQ